jgi:hypothetical protein
MKLKEIFWGQQEKDRLYGALLGVVYTLTIIYFVIPGIRGVF